MGGKGEVGESVHTKVTAFQSKWLSTSWPLKGSCQFTLYQPQLECLFLNIFHPTSIIHASFIFCLKITTPGWWLLFVEMRTAREEMEGRQFPFSTSHVHALCIIPSPTHTIWQMSQFIFINILMEALARKKTPWNQETVRNQKRSSQLLR